MSHVPQIKPVSVCINDLNQRTSWNGFFKTSAEPIENVGRHRAPASYLYHHISQSIRLIYCRVTRSLFKEGIDHWLIPAAECNLPFVMRSHNFTFIWKLNFPCSQLTEDGMGLSRWVLPGHCTYIHVLTWQAEQETLMTTFCHALWNCHATKVSFTTVQKLIPRL